MKEAFASMVEMEIKDKLARFPDDFLIEVDGHKALFFWLQILVGTHNAAKIADAGWFQPETKGWIRESGLPAPICQEGLKEALPVSQLFHPIFYIMFRGRGQILKKL